MAPTKEQVLERLGDVSAPDGRPLPQTGALSDIVVSDGKVFFSMTVDAAVVQRWEPVRKAAEDKVRGIPGVASVLVALTAERAGGGARAPGRAAPAAGPAAHAGGGPRPAKSPEGVKSIIAVASGKGGVGKSSVTVNLAVALAARGLQVGVLDADIYGFSVPRMLGVTTKPTQVEKMIMPPQAHDVKVISIGMFTPGNSAVVWRGPMLHRALQQFLSDVFWGDLDVLLMDLPPGTGDIAISLAQLVPSAELLVVTTPQLAAREVAERAGSIALQTHQQIVGVVENMSWLDQPDGSRLELFGSGGGQAVAESLTKATGTTVGLLGQVPIDVAVREGGDTGAPIVLTHPESAAAKAFGEVADYLAGRQRSLVGRSLGLSPASR